MLCIASSGRPELHSESASPQTKNQPETKTSVSKLLISLPEHLQLIFMPFIKVISSTVPRNSTSAVYYYEPNTHGHVYKYIKEYI